VVNVADSNIDCFLCRNVCVSSTQLKSPIWSKERLENYDLQDGYTSNTN
jgi:hypothetical protein